MAAPRRVGAGVSRKVAFRWEGRAIEGSIAVQGQHAAWTRDAIGAAMKAEAAKHGLKPGQVMMASRVLVCGTRETPAIDAVLALLGRETTLARLSAHLHRPG